MDQDLVLNQDLKDLRIDQDYDQMSLEIPLYCRGVSNTPASYKPKLLSSLWVINPISIPSFEPGLMGWEDGPRSGFEPGFKRFEDRP